MGIGTSAIAGYTGGNARAESDGPVKVGIHADARNHNCLVILATCFG